MRIEPSSGQVPVSQTQAPAARPTTRPADGGAATESATFVPTSELAGLLQAVRESPDIRADVVEAVSARLAAGELATIGAAAQTAQAIPAGDLAGPAAG